MRMHTSKIQFCERQCNEGSGITTVRGDLPVELGM